MFESLVEARTITGRNRFGVRRVRVVAASGVAGGGRARLRSVRVVDGMVAKAAKRVAETSDRRRRGARSHGCCGVGTGEVRGRDRRPRRSSSTLPATDAAVRAGRLSAAEAKLIAGRRDGESGRGSTTCLTVAEQGLVPLRDACVAGARRGRRSGRAGEASPRATAVRGVDRRGRDDRPGSYRLAPEVGGPIKAVFERRGRNASSATARPAPTTNRIDAYAADAVAGVRARAHRRATRHRKACDDATVHIVVDHGALVRGGTADGEVCEIPGVGPVDVSWVRELIGSAFLTVVIKQGQGHPHRRAPRAPHTRRSA